MAGTVALPLLINASPNAGRVGLFTDSTGLGGYVSSLSLGALSGYPFTLSFVQPGGTLSGVWDFLDVSSALASGAITVAISPYNPNGEAVGVVPPTGGSFLITYDSKVTAALPYNATQEQMQTALSGILAGGETIAVLVAQSSSTVSASSVFRATFGQAGARASTFVPNSDLLQPVGSQCIATRIVAGVGDVCEVWEFSIQQGLYACTTQSAMSALPTLSSTVNATRTLAGTSSTPETQRITLSPAPYNGTAIWSFARPEITSIGCGPDQIVTAAVSGSTYAAGTVSLSNVITFASAPSGITAGMAITGTGIPANTYVTSIASTGLSLAMSNAATATQANDSLSFYGSYLNNTVAATLDDENGPVQIALSVGPVQLGARVPPPSGGRQIAVSYLPTGGAPLVGTAATSGATTITVTSTQGLAVGMGISGVSGIPSSATISSIGTSSIVLSSAATAALAAGTPLTVQFPSASAVTTTAATTSGNATVSVASTTGLAVGMQALATGIPATATVSSIGSGNVVLSSNATATETSESAFFCYPGTAANIAALVQRALAADASYTASTVSGSVVTAPDTNNGPRTIGAAGAAPYASGFSVSEAQSGCSIAAALAWNVTGSVLGTALGGLWTAGLTESGVWDLTSTVNGGQNLITVSTAGLLTPIGVSGTLDLNTDLIRSAEYGQGNTIPLALVVSIQYPSGKPQLVLNIPCNVNRNPVAGSLSVSPIASTGPQTFSIALASGVNSFTATFSPAMPNANWKLRECSIENYTDTGSTLQLMSGSTITARATTGFTRLLNGTTNTANYIAIFTVDP